jgi:polyketide biosynthesis acyl carrier protein
MGREQVFTVVREEILSVRPDVDPEQIREDRSMTDLGCDSLDRIDVVAGAMDRIGLELSTDRLADVRDIGGLVDVLCAGAEEAS